MKPEAGEGSGSAVSWLTSATLNCVKFDWNALLKCAEWVVPSGSTASLLTTRPVGPNTSSNSVASLPGRLRLLCLRRPGSTTDVHSVTMRIDGFMESPRKEWR